MVAPKIIVVTGPTASGKSAFGMALAEDLGGEIVSADSMQVYRGLDIGTAKPTAEERSRIPHHLVDVAEIEEPYHAGRFRDEAGCAIRDIRSRGAVPLVVGGTALYLRALLHGLAPAPGRDEEIRRELESRWEAGDTARLWEELRRADPALAQRLHPRDRTRIIRGLEVWATTGQPLSSLQGEHGFSERPYDALVLGMEVQRRELYARIDERVIRMMDSGWVAEVEALLARGHRPDLPPLQAIGYREVVAALLTQGGDRASELVPAIQRQTRRFAKRQLTWFRRMEVEWVDSRDVERGVGLARKFLQKTPVPIS